MWRLSVFVALAALPGSAQPNNYGDATSWLCRPGQRDACDVDLTTTVIAPGGKLSRETWTADPSGGRTDDIVGDLRGNGGVQAKWGLHLVDVNLAMGNLLDVVGQQSGAWLARAGSR
jgi:hypothetical protein